MRDTGNQSSKPIHRSPIPATLPDEPDHSAEDQEHGELSATVKHLTEDKLVAWGWTPGMDV